MDEARGVAALLRSEGEGLGHASVPGSQGANTISAAQSLQLCPHELVGVHAVTMSLNNMLLEKWVHQSHDSHMMSRQSHDAPDRYPKHSPSRRHPCPDAIWRSPP